MVQEDSTNPDYAAIWKSITGKEPDKDDMARIQHAILGAKPYSDEIPSDEFNMMIASTMDVKRDVSIAAVEDLIRKEAEREKTRIITIIRENAAKARKKVERKLEDRNFRWGVIGTAAGIITLSGVIAISYAGCAAKRALINEAKKEAVVQEVIGEYRGLISEFRTTFTSIENNLFNIRKPSTLPDGIDKEVMEHFLARNIAITYWHPERGDIIYEQQHNSVKIRAKRFSFASDENPHGSYLLISKIDEDSKLSTVYGFKCRYSSPDSSSSLISDSYPVFAFEFEGDKANVICPDYETAKRHLKPEELNTHVGLATRNFGAYEKDLEKVLDQFSTLFNPPTVKE